MVALAVAIAIGAFTAAAIGAVVFSLRLHRILTKRELQFNLRSLLILMMAAPCALWIVCWAGEDVYQWLAMSVLAAVVFLLLKR